jgi:uncharacterized protein (DUF58 family)
MAVSPADLPAAPRAKRLASGATFGFDSAFLARMERMTLHPRRPVAGMAAGRRRSPRRGSSVEFADFRDYCPGDDIRRVDWRAYARLDRLYLRLYTAEEVAPVTIFIDRSASMSFGEPDKSTFAGRLAAVLSYVALHGYDTVAVAGFDTKLSVYHPPRGGRVSIPQVWWEIANVTVDSRPATRERGTDFMALRHFGHFRRGGGVSVVISDFLTTSDWQAGLRALMARGQELTVMQVLAPEEADPTLRGHWQLVDVEGSRGLDVTASSRVVKAYRKGLEDHCEAIRQFCRSKGAGYVRLSSADPIEEVTRTLLRHSGVVQ